MKIEKIVITAGPNRYEFTPEELKQLKEEIDKLSFMFSENKNTVTIGS